MNDMDAVTNVTNTVANVTEKLKEYVNSLVKKQQRRRPFNPQPKTVYVVVELAYHDDYLSGADVVGVFMDKHKADRIAKNVTTNGKSDQYEYRGKVYEIIML